MERDPSLGGIATAGCEVHGSFGLAKLAKLNLNKQESPKALRARSMFESKYLNHDFNREFSSLRFGMADNSRDQKRIEFGMANYTRDILGDFSREPWISTNLPHRCMYNKAKTPLATCYTNATFDTCVLETSHRGRELQYGVW